MLVKVHGLLSAFNNGITLTWISNKPTSTGKCTITLPKSYNTIPCASRVANVYSDESGNRAIRSTTALVTKTQISYWSANADKYMFIICGV